jgi:cytosine deaminase
VSLPVGEIADLGPQWVSSGNAGDAEMDLIVRAAQLVERAPGELVDIGVEAGRIVAIEPKISADARIYEAAGHLTCGGLVETHIHLDKSRLLGRCPAEKGRAINPVRYVEAFKPGISEEDVYERAEATLRECLLNGTTRIRTHVEIDPKIGLRGFNAVERLARDYAWAVDLQLCAFPQDGLTDVPGTEELLVEALRRGTKVIGGAPRYDSDEHGQIRRIFALAREYDCDIDLHLDAGHTADSLNVHLVADLTEQYRLGGRVTVGHMSKLSLMPPEAVATIARRLADIGVAVTVLPATELYLIGRNVDHTVPRGVADVHFLLGHGVNCSLSSNNVLNPATPFGDCSLIRIANLQANVLQVGQPADLAECFDMISRRSARLLNATDYGIAVGNPADITVIDSFSPEAAIAEIRRPLAVFKAGRQTVVCEPAKLLS